MIFQRTTDQMNSWKNQMKDYQKGKRTKKPFGQSMPKVSHVSYEDIKIKQNKFNPVLQTYKYKEDAQNIDSVQQINRVKSLMNHIKNVHKYEKNYDIINLHTSQDSRNDQKPFNKKLGPIRNAYNVINNQKLPEFYFKGRDMQLPVPKQKTLFDYHKKEFDIITGNYKESNQQKQNRQKIQEDLNVMNKYWKSHNYDPVFGKFYDSKKEDQYRRQLQAEQKEHGKDFDKKFPPSYVYREPLILDFEKPLPQTLKTLDEKQMNKMRKFQLKYYIQDEYEHRNFEEQEKYEKVIKNRIHDGRLLDQKSKQFDIITNKNYPNNRAQTLYGKKPKLNNWQEYIKPSDNLSKPIKSSGFN